ncbi:hypothetical protein N9J84_03510 [Porticoccaceae bacterium]|nr:hypothetical protein [Porticoccaceae bacterium]
MRVQDDIQFVTLSVSEGSQSAAVAAVVEQGLLLVLGDPSLRSG